MPDATQQHETNQVELYDLPGIEIFAAGTRTDSSGRSHTYTEQALDEMVRAHERLPREGRARLGHDPQKWDKAQGDRPALGYVSKLRRIGSTLVADFAGVPKALFDAIKRGLYDSVSSEIYHNWTYDGQRFPYVLHAVAFLGDSVPAVTGLKSLSGLYQADLSEHLYAYHPAQSRPESISTPQEGTMADQVQVTKPAAATPPEENPEVARYAAQVVELQGKTAQLESSNAALQARVAAAEAEAKRHAFETRKAYVAEWVRQRSTPQTLKILPKDRDTVEWLLLNAPEERKFSVAGQDGKTTERPFGIVLQDLLDNLPNLAQLFTAEVAKVAGTDLLAGTETNHEKLHKLIVHRCNQTKEPYHAAYAAVLAEHPELERNEE